MSDKEKIETLILTMVHLVNALDILIKSTKDPEMIDCLGKMKHTINFVIDKNANQIDISDADVPR